MRNSNKKVNSQIFFHFRAHFSVLPDQPAFRKTICHKLTCGEPDFSDALVRNAFYIFDKSPQTALVGADYHIFSLFYCRQDFLLEIGHCTLINSNSNYTHLSTYNNSKLASLNLFWSNQNVSNIEST